jgi:CheY-like chemotaxis protein
VAITGHADDAGRKAALEKRFDVHVPKPVDASKLAQSLIKLGADE